MPTRNMNKAHAILHKTAKTPQMMKREVEKVAHQFYKDVERLDLKYGFLGTLIDELDALHRADPTKEHDQQVLKVYGMYEDMNQAMSDLHRDAYDISAAVKRLKI